MDLLIIILFAFSVLYLPLLYLIAVFGELSFQKGLRISISRMHPVDRRIFFYIVSFVWLFTAAAFILFLIRPTTIITPPAPTPTPNPIVVVSPTSTSSLPTTPGQVPIPTATPQALFTSPIASVGWENSCRGEIDYVPRGYHLWLVIVQNNKYHPQTGGPLVVTEKNWQGTCLIGGGADTNIGERFIILAVLVDDSGNQEFNEYLDDSESLEYRGLDSLPSASITVGATTVIRISG